MRARGLIYVDDFVTGDEERRLLAVLEGLDYRAVTMHGQTARSVTFRTLRRDSG